MDNFHDITNTTGSTTDSALYALVGDRMVHQGQGW